MPEQNKLWEYVSKDRYTYVGKYKLDKWLFTVIFFVIVLYCFHVAKEANYDMNYFQCGGESCRTNIHSAPIRDGEYLKNLSTIDGKKQAFCSQELCKNPFYEPVSWKNQEYLPGGEYGYKPTTMFNWAGKLAFLLCVLGLIINHFVHNRRSEDENNNPQSPE